MSETALGVAGGWEDTDQDLTAPTCNSNGRFESLTVLTRNTFAGGRVLCIPPPPGFPLQRTFSDSANLPNVATIGVVGEELRFGHSLSIFSLLTLVLS